MSLPGTDVTVTVSVGVAGFPEHASTPDRLERLADAALYLAKRQGRNRVELAEPSVVVGAFDAPAGPGAGPAGGPRQPARLAALTGPRRTRARPPPTCSRAPFRRDRAGLERERPGFQRERAGVRPGARPQSRERLASERIAHSVQNLARGAGGDHPVQFPGEGWACPG